VVILPAAGAAAPKPTAFPRALRSRR
jgi:hypothetical protein